MPGAGAAQCAASSGGAAQPATPGSTAPRLFTLADLNQASSWRQIIRRPEATSAFQTLLHNHYGETAPGAFEWLRWLASLAGAREFFQDSVHKVSAVRWEQDGGPEAVFCYGNGTYCTLAPHVAHYRGAKKQTRVRWYTKGNWATGPLLVAAPVAARAGLPLRDEVIW